MNFDKIEYFEKGNIQIEKLSDSDKEWLMQQISSQFEIWPLAVFWGFFFGLLGGLINLSLSLGFLGFILGFLLFSWQYLGQALLYFWDLKSDRKITGIAEIVEKNEHKESPSSLPKKMIIIDLDKHRTINTYDNTAHRNYAMDKLEEGYLIYVEVTNNANALLEVKWQNKWNSKKQLKARAKKKQASKRKTIWNIFKK